MEALLSYVSLCTNFEDKIFSLSLKKLSLGGNNIFPPREGLISDIPAGGTGMSLTFFLQCSVWYDHDLDSNPELKGSLQKTAMPLK